MSLRTAIGLFPNFSSAYMSQSPQNPQILEVYFTKIISTVIGYLGIWPLSRSVKNEKHALVTIFTTCVYQTVIVENK
jgi:hypothetical protein